ncbi:MAG: manganese catalase family protein [Ruminiclostridium sp.]|nr:manganese catalase family protein [Ruminiclostridium sp.]
MGTHQTGKRINRTLLHFGGPDGELGASIRYLSQRYSMPYPRVQGLLTDIGTEEYKPQ